MTIGHYATLEHVKVKDDEAFVFAAVGGFTCSICAPSSWTVADVLAFTELRFPTEGASPWRSVNKSDLGLGTRTPNPCNHVPMHRTHWFMMRGN